MTVQSVMKIDPTILVFLGGIAFSVISACLITYTKLMVRLKTLETRMDMMNLEVKRNDVQYKEIIQLLGDQNKQVMGKLEGHDKILTEIKVEMQNKQNRPL